LLISKSRILSCCASRIILFSIALRSRAFAHSIFQSAIRAQ
jgi:hypothetical protein